MQVFKFGGASVKDAAAVRNVANILQQYKNQPLVIIVSAMGKVTNALEAVVNAYMYSDGALRRARLHGHRPDAGGERAVRPRARRVHGRPSRPARRLRAGPSRHAVPGRDRRDAAAIAEAAAARPPGGPLPPGR